MAFQMKGLGSLLGKGSEPIKQENKNLIDLNPIANHASEGNGPAKPKEKRRVKIESKGMAGQGSTEYVRGNRSGENKGRSVIIEKDHAGVDQKVVKRKKKDGTVKTKTIKISEKRAEKIKKRKDKSHGPARKIEDLEEKSDIDEVVITPKTRREKKGKNTRLKSFEGETSEQAKKRRGENKQNRKDARREKTAGKLEKAKTAAVESGSKTGKSKETLRQTAKAKRLAKRSKRQEGRVERKSIRSGEIKPTKKVSKTTKDPLSGISRDVEKDVKMTKREAIKASRKKKVN